MNVFEETLQTGEHDCSTLSFDRLRISLPSAGKQDRMRCDGAREDEAESTQFKIVRKS